MKSTLSTFSLLAYNNINRYKLLYQRGKIYIGEPFSSNNTADYTCWKEDASAWKEKKTLNRWTMINLKDSYICSCIIHANNIVISTRQYYICWDRRDSTCPDVILRTGICTENHIQYPQEISVGEYYYHFILIRKQLYTLICMNDFNYETNYVTKMLHAVNISFKTHS